MALCTSAAVAGGLGVDQAPSLSATPPVLAPVAKLLEGTVPSVVAAATKLGALAPSSTMTVVAPLTLPHRAALTDYLSAEYTKGSPTYHQFLNPQGFTAYFGASTAHVNTVTRVLDALGFNVAPVAANHLYVEFSGPAGLIERTFNTVIDRLRLPAALTTFVSNVTDLTLPPALSGLVSGLVGLDSLAVPQDNLAFPTAAARAAVGTAAAAGALPTAIPDTGIDGGSAPCVAQIAGAGYTAPELARAYGFDGLYGQGYLGQGMTASLVEFDDYHDSNVATVQSCLNDPGTTVQRRLVDGGSGGPPAAGEVEVMSDVTAMLEMLPELSTLDVYVAPLTTTAEFDLWNAFVTDDNSPVLSSSWGNCEENAGASYARLLNVLAEEAAAQGQQIFEAAGDSGAVDCRGTPPPTGDSISVMTEAASPYVTGVGGTDLGQRTALGLGQGRDEDTWNDAGAGGGGQSTYWSMPSWQAAVPSVTTTPGTRPSACGAPAGTLCRELPDLSADADPDFGLQTKTKLQFHNDVGSLGYSIYCGTANCDLLGQLLPIELPITLPPPPALPDGLGGWFPVGGTSLATPLTAAAYLLWDQEARAHGLPRLGFLNPDLYAVAADPGAYARDFYDITSDSNSAQYDTSDCPSGCNPSGLYPAGPGYDMASGLGSYNATNLGADLVAQAAQVTLTPDTATVYGYTAGPPTTTPVVVSSAATYAVATSAPWLHATGGANGTLSWSADPTGMRPGSYTGSITVTGAGRPAVLIVSYSVTPPAALSVSPGALSFSESAQGPKGQAAAPSCDATVWNDGLAGQVGGIAPALAADPASRQTLRITNSGPVGSVLHWSAFFYSETSSWLSQDIDPPGSGLGTVAAPPLVSTEGAQAAGTTTPLYLASYANANALGGYPPMNQGTYHGVVLLRDLADPTTVVSVPATLVLGSGHGTPAMVATPAALHVSVGSGITATTALTLSDASKTCGYVFSAQSNVPWATVDPGAAAPSGTVAGGGATTTLPIVLDTSGLAPGTYHGSVEVQTQNAQPNPVTVPLTLTVTGAA
jgi:hypothetical protein